ncbi:MAG: cyclic nucleotide-binding domain-containing protein [Pseudomonadales bacterium]|jgi:CRP-like cAMP-binding protein|nr:cyclic nucleotide-binding domain-containing protein [Pseudomonadales bacterium]
MTDTLLDRLARHPFLEGFDTAALGALASASRLRSVAAGTLVAREDAPADHFYLIEAGHLAIETPRRGGAGVVLQTLGPGDAAGWSWLLEDRWMFDLRAADDAWLIEVDARRVREIVDADPAFAERMLRRVLRMVTTRLQATRLRLLDVYGP